VPRALKNEELRNEVCLAATQALEFSLVMAACQNIRQASDVEKSDRARIEAWFKGGKLNMQRPERTNDLEFFHTISLLQSGFVGDALPYAKKYLTEGSLSVPEQLLAFSLLRILAHRQVDTATSHGIAKVLTEYSGVALKKAQNEQARSFYAMLAKAVAVFEKGEAEFSRFSPDKDVPSSGVLLTHNLLFRTALATAPVRGASYRITPTNFPGDAGLEADLKFYADTDGGFAALPDCLAQNCSLLIKRHLAREQKAEALRLILSGQGISDAGVVAGLKAGMFGYAEVFTDEVYEWYHDGGSLSFTRVDDFPGKTPVKIKSGRKYLAYTPRRNIFMRLRMPPPREAVLADVAANFTVVPTVPDSVQAPAASTLYSALYAQWGSGKKTGKNSVQVKPAFHTAAGLLHIYTESISLEDVGRLRPGGYHLFCTPEESYNQFVPFAMRVIENAFARNMTPEQAYEAAFAGLKGKQASTRPLYYLYRN
jgi:hypothetical protein